MLQVTKISTHNIREITKKEKFLRLNLNSWFICGLCSISIINFSFLYALALFIFMLVVFYIAEFFDEDITDIIFASSQLKSGIKNYYA